MEEPERTQAARGPRSPSPTVITDPRPVGSKPSRQEDGGEAECSTKQSLAARDVARSKLDALFASLYPELPEEDGLKTSRNERLEKGYRSVTLTYGEVSAIGVST